MRLLKFLVTRTVRICVLVVVLMVLFTDCLITQIAFYPDKNVYYVPEEEHISEVFFKTEDNVSIHAYFVKHTPREEKCIIYFHGNAGNNSHRIDDAKRLYSFGVDVLLVSYRGYGKSDGSPSEKGIYKDAEASLAYILNNGYKEENVFVLGRSIGSTAAVYVSQERSLGGVILVTPLTTAEDMADAAGLGLFRFLGKGKLDNMSKINSLKTRVLFIHGDNDSVVPYSLGKKLYNAYNGEKSFVTIPGGGHNDLSIVDENIYWMSIRDFLIWQEIED